MKAAGNRWAPSGRAAGGANWRNARLQPATHPPLPELGGPLIRLCESSSTARAPAAPPLPPASSEGRRRRGDRAAAQGALSQGAHQTTAGPAADHKTRCQNSAGSPGPRVRLCYTAAAQKAPPEGGQHGAAEQESGKQAICWGAAVVFRGGLGPGLSRRRRASMALSRGRSEPAQAVQPRGRLRAATHRI